MQKIIIRSPKHNKHIYAVSTWTRKENISRLSAEGVICYDIFIITLC